MIASNSLFPVSSNFEFGKVSMQAPDSNGLLNEVAKISYVSNQTFDNASGYGCTLSLYNCNSNSTGVSNTPSLFFGSQGWAGINTANLSSSFTVNGTFRTSGIQYYDALQLRCTNTPYLHFGHGSNGNPVPRIAYNWARRDDGNPGANEGGLYGRDNTSYGRSAFGFPTGTGNIQFLTQSSVSSSANVNNLPPITMTLFTTGNLTISGTLSKGSGSFEIEHPITPNKKLVHSFIEGPRCDLLYRGSVQLRNGIASVNLDTDCVAQENSQMSLGTFEKLARNAQYFLSNSTGFSALKGSFVANVLQIECENKDSTDVITWLVVAERNDSFIHETNMTNFEGYLQTEK